MYLQTVIVFIVTVLLLFTANVADDVFYVDMPSELVFIEEVTRAEATIGVHKSDISKLVDVSLFLMPAEGFVGVEFLFLEHAGLLINAYVAGLWRLYHM